MMGVQRIKELVLLLIGLVYGIYVDGQQISYVKMKGDTYKIDMMADWKLCTSEQISKKPMRRKIAGYETVCMTRICPDYNLGVSVSVLEFKGCKDYKKIQKMDSLSFVDSQYYSTVTWGKPGSVKVKQSVELVCMPVRHLETGKNIYMGMKKWYVQGKENVYLIDFVSSSTLGWNKWLPEMEKMILSLKEID